MIAEVSHRKGGTISGKLIKDGSELTNTKVSVLPYGKNKLILVGNQVGNTKNKSQVELDLVGFESMKAYKRKYDINVSRVSPVIQNVKDASKY